MSYPALQPLPTAPDANSSIQALLVDGDPVSLARMRWLLENEAEMEVTEYSAGAQAITALRRRAPDLLVLDVQLPEIQRAGSLEALGLERLPVTIVTAYDPHLLSQFAAKAVDRLIKPFEGEQFARALRRAKMEIQRTRAEEMNQWKVVPPQAEGPARTHLQRFVVKLGARIVFVRVEEVDWIQSAANYVRLHAGSNSYTVRETMSRVESMLDPARFLRVHRNAIVNLDAVQQFESSPQGSMTAIMRDGARLPLSRSYRTTIRKMLRKGV